MESFQAMDNREEDQIELPPGFRFHPTDEELITHYLSKKFVDNNFNAGAVGEVDLNKCEPWDLPWRAKMGEKEWYFFCVRDRKYPTGMRTNRATESGYWKATGKDKEIHRGKALVGMKKTLVFYKGRAPKGEKTSWVMHEYRLEGNFPHHNLPKDSKSEWVICRIFNKSSSGKKTPLAGLLRISSLKDEFDSSPMPPLMDSPYSNMVTSSESAHVNYFSNGMGGQKIHGDMIDTFAPSSSFFTNTSDVPFSTLLRHKTSVPSQGSLFCSSSAFMQDHAVLRALLESHDSGMKHACKPENELVSVSQETGTSGDMNTEISSLVTDPQMGRRCMDELDYLWDY